LFVDILLLYYYIFYYTTIKARVQIYNIFADSKAKSDYFSYYCNIICMTDMPTSGENGDNKWFVNERRKCI